MIANKDLFFFFNGIQEGLTAEETEKKEPDDAERMQVFYPFLTI